MFNSPLTRQPSIEPLHTGRQPVDPFHECAAGSRAVRAFQHSEDPFELPLDLVEPALGVRRTGVPHSSGWKDVRITLERAAVGRG
jgi:hypothetical protein